MRLIGSRQVRVLIASTAVLALTTALFAVSIKVTGSSFSANGQAAPRRDYTGPCPVDLQFDWTVVSVDRENLFYTTSRSDRTESSQRGASLGPNQPSKITDHWKLGSSAPAFKNYAGWMQLNMKSPAQGTDKIAFTLHCR
jgi:hypothetical protein